MGQNPSFSYMEIEISSSFWHLGSWDLLLSFLCNYSGFKYITPFLPLNIWTSQEKLKSADIKRYVFCSNFFSFAIENFRNYSYFLILLAEKKNEGIPCFSWIWYCTQWQRLWFWSPNRFHTGPKSFNFFHMKFLKFFYIFVIMFKYHLCYVFD